MTNQGPAATAYELTGAIDYPVVFGLPVRLRAGRDAERPEAEPLGGGVPTLFTYEYDCLGRALDARLSVRVVPLGGTTDPNPNNNRDTWTTEVR